MTSQSYMLCCLWQLVEVKRISGLTAAPEGWAVGERLRSRAHEAQRRRLTITHRSGEGVCERRQGPELALVAAGCKSHQSHEHDSRDEVLVGTLGR